MSVCSACGGTGIIEDSGCWGNGVPTSEPCGVCGGTGRDGNDDNDEEDSYDD